MRANPYTINGNRPIRSYSTLSLSADMLMIVLIFLSAACHCLPTRGHRLSLAEWGSYNFRDHKGPGTYAFGYDLEDPLTNNIQFREEERHLNGTVTGSYGYVQPDGQVRILNYIADARGYRVNEGKPHTPQPVHTKPRPTTELPLFGKPNDETFEAEFYPVTEVATNDLTSMLPIQFPRKDLVPSTHYVNKNSVGRPAIQNSYSYYAPSTKNSIQNPARPMTNKGPILIYENPVGGPSGWVKFRLGRNP